MAHARVAISWSLLVSASVACGPPRAVPTPAPSATAAPTSAAPLAPPDLSGGVFVSKRFDARLALPGKEKWRIDDTRTPWLTASQEATRSNVLLRTWFDENRMTRDRCEERARALRPIPTRDGATMLEQRRLDVPPGFDTVADVFVQNDPGSDKIYGFVLAFGGNARRCFAYVYVTSESGAGGEARIADRLAQMVERSLATLVFESSLALPPRP